MNNRKADNTPIELHEMNDFSEQKYLMDNPEQQFFYAVGTAIDLFVRPNTGHYISTLYTQSDHDYYAKSYRRSSVSLDEITRSLYSNKEIHLFTQLPEAHKYCYFNATFFYNLGAKSMYAKPAVFVVSVKDAYNLKQETLTLSEQWLCAVSKNDKLPSKSVTYLKTAADNLQAIHFVNFKAPKGLGFFGGTMQKNSYPSSALWDVTLNANIPQAAQQAIIQLFADYEGAWYTRFTRHHTQLAADIVEHLQSHSGLSLPAMLTFLKGQRDGADDVQDVDKQGDYYKRLDFAINQLSDMLQIANLPGIDEYKGIVHNKL